MPGPVTLLNFVNLSGSRSRVLEEGCRRFAPSLSFTSKRECVVRRRSRAKLPAARTVTLFLGLLLAPGLAYADVIEVGNNGASVVRASDKGWSGQPIDAISGTLDADTTIDLDGLPATALTTVRAPVVPDTVNLSFFRAAAQADVSPALLEALVWKESRWRPDALSVKGAMGLTQLMPGTARDLLVDPRDHAANLSGGARYLRKMLDLFDGDIEKALAAYNAGPGRVRSARGVPAIAETRDYVSSIIDRLGLNSALPAKDLPNEDR